MTTPWNLLQTMSDDEKTEYREGFVSYSYQRQQPIKNQNEVYGLQSGDAILFRNGYGMPMITEILGFEGIEEAYLLWDCFWFPIRLSERLIEKVNF